MFDLYIDGLFCGRTWSLRSTLWRAITTLIETDLVTICGQGPKSGAKPGIQAALIRVNSTENIKIPILREMRKAVSLIPSCESQTVAIPSGVITEAPLAYDERQERLGTARTKRLERPSEAALRDAESPRDIDLTTCVLINQLGCI